jgi:hypothetical protein
MLTQCACCMDRLSAWTGSGHGPAQLLSALKATSHEGHLGTDSWGSRLASSRIVMVCRYPLHGQIAIMKSPRSAQTSTMTSTTVTYNKRDGMATNSWPVAHNAYHSLILHAAEVDAYACIHSFCAGTALTPCITRTRMAHAGYKCKGEVCACRAAHHHVGHYAQRSTAASESADTLSRYAVSSESAEHAVLTGTRSTDIKSKGRCDPL